MAYITRIYRLDPLEGARPHSTSECSWRVSNRETQKVVQLDTYGSPARKDVGTVSQSIQLDETAAVELVRVLREAFPSIR